MGTTHVTIAINAEDIMKYFELIIVVGFIAFIAYVFVSYTWSIILYRKVCNILNPYFDDYRIYMAAHGLVKDKL